jgi:hypothetical protein
MGLLHAPVNQNRRSLSRSPVRTNQKLLVRGLVNFIQRFCYVFTFDVHRKSFENQNTKHNFGAQRTGLLVKKSTWNLRGVATSLPATKRRKIILNKITKLSEG